jgi:hypothetical protein
MKEKVLTNGVYYNLCNIDGSNRASTEKLMKRTGQSVKHFKGQQLIVGDMANDIFRFVYFNMLDNQFFGYTGSLNREEVSLPTIDSAIDHISTKRKIIFTDEEVIILFNDRYLRMDFDSNGRNIQADIIMMDTGDIVESYFYTFLQW